MKTYLIRSEHISSGIIVHVHTTNAIEAREYLGDLNSAYPAPRYHNSLWEVSGTWEEHSQPLLKGTHVRDLPGARHLI